MDTITETQALYPGWELLLRAVLGRAIRDGYLCKVSRCEREDARAFLAEPAVAELCREIDLDMPKMLRILGKREASGQ